MFSLLLESATRSLALGILVWAGLKLLRVRDPQPRSKVWTAVLLSAVTMPLLMPLMKILVPGLMSAASWIPAAGSPLFLRPLTAIGTAPLAQSFEWTMLALVLSAAVTGGFLVRLLSGVVRSRRLWKASVPLNEPWTGGSDVRESRELLIPVTYGSTIILPADWSQWSAFKREAVLLHEQSHVRRRDFHINLIASLHRAVFWFNPLSWWLERELLHLAEEACDDEAIMKMQDPQSYAEILIELAARQSRTDLAVVAMARGKTVALRVERALRHVVASPSASPVKRGLFAVTLALIIGLTAGGHLVDAEAVLPQAAQGLAAWPAQEVPDLISAQERDAFERLRTDEERLKFIEQFWLRRDPTPGTPANEFREEYYRRIVEANQRFTSGIAGWRTDRGRVLIMHGLPDQLESHPEGRRYRRRDGTTAVLPYEMWQYRFIEGVGANVIVEFVDIEANGNYRLQFDPKDQSPDAKPLAEPVR
jgi:GWxTD domain-containing protein